MAAASRSRDPRIGRAFAEVPREAFLGPPPWRVLGGPMLTAAVTGDPAELYRNVLVALDPARHLNNGEPSLHAAWIGRAAPQPGETVCHVGAGTGYYTAILAELVAPGGRVVAFEIEPGLAARAAENLAGRPEVTVICGDATVAELPRADIVYVNAGVAAPPLAWLDALAPGGRMVFPWRPSRSAALALLVQPGDAGGFAATPLMPVWFVPCAGASEEAPEGPPPDAWQAERVRSLWRRAARAPDDSAVAVFRDVWFSTAEAPGA